MRPHAERVKQVKTGFTQIEKKQIPPSSHYVYFFQPALKRARKEVKYIMLKVDGNEKKRGVRTEIVIQVLYGTF